MNDISLKQLRYFRAVAQFRHFGRAAEACAISQPALSVQMKELEGSLGAQLIERGARRIQLTELGMAISARAEKLLKDVDDLHDLARASQTALTGRLRLGIIPTVAPYMLPGVIKAVRKHYPAIDLRPRETVTQNLLADLKTGRLDVAIMALPVSESALTSVPLFEEEFMLVRPADQAKKPVPDVKKLKELRLLLLEEGHCFRDQALSYCHVGPASARDVMEGSNLSTLVQMVAAGMGVTLIPKMAVDVETASLKVDVTRLPAPRPTRRIGLVWRKSNPLAPHLLALADRLKKTGL